MRMNRLTMLALLVATVACTAYGQTGPYGGQPQPGPYGGQPPGPYGGQPGPQGQYDPYNQPGGGYQNPSVDVGFFYNELSPYGEWVMHPQYGWAWFPRNVMPGWRPYTLGRWVESDYGWTWASDEPFGWATYHYGRWAWDPQIGWLWVPGTVWGPAWVAWQQGNGYVGWAPLPPAVGFEIGVGIHLGGFNLSLGIAPRDYSFVDERRFLDPRIGGYILPEARNITIINNTTNITNYTVVNNRVINHGVPIERIEQVTGRKAQRLRVAVAPSPRNAGVQRDVISIYQPPQSKLETVAVARRNNAGLPVAAPRTDRPEAVAPTGKPPAVTPYRQGTAPLAIPVAPRVKPAPQAVDERQFARQQKALQTNLDNERKALEQIHRQEMAQSQAKANAQEVAKRQAAELQALQEQRQGAALRLQTRQQIERQAAQASAAKAQKAPPKPVKQPPAKPKDEKKVNDQKPPQSL